jgi:hypothetical protein
MNARRKSRLFHETLPATGRMGFGGVLYLFWGQRALLGLWVAGLRLTETFVTPLRSHHTCGGEFYCTKVPIDTLVSACCEERQIDERKNSGASANVHLCVFVGFVARDLLSSPANALR